MKVRTKIALLLLFVFGTFILALFAFKTSDSRKFRRLSREYAQEREKSFDAFIQRWTMPLDAIATDYSCWDDMVSAISRNDKKWAEENLGDGTLTAARANAIWVYTPDRRLFHTHNNLYSEALNDAPLPPEAIGTALDEKKLCHFFAVTALGLFEVRGATIHPSHDSARSTPIQGYLFLGHYWSREDLKDVSILTGHTVEIVPKSDNGYRAGGGRVGAVSFTRELAGWNGTPLAKFVVRNDSLVLQQLHSSSRREFLWLLLFAAVLFLLLGYSLTQWVYRPIRFLSRCLQTRSREPIHSLESDPSEFGDLARLIRAFFDQRKSLIEEMTERRKMEEALHESEDRLRHSQEER